MSQVAGAEIEIVGVRKSFGATEAVAGVDITVPAGSFLVLLGPSGCGKSTILRMLAGLEEPSDGSIRFGGDLVASGERGIVRAPGERDAGLVFQSYALWPHMTVAGNVEWPLKVKRWPAARRDERVREVLALLEIAELARRYPNEISGGQQQRVAIARMIAPRPRILLFDEPLSNLDARLRIDMRAELMRVHRATGATTVYVTHDQVEAVSMASHVAVMRGGHVEQFGPPVELLDRPASAFVATFVGTPPANLLPASMFGANGAVAQYMYRPESIRIADGPGPRRIELRFAEAVPMAGRYLVSGHAGALRLAAISDARPDLVYGQNFHVEIPEKPDAAFSSNGRRLA